MRQTINKVLTNMPGQKTEPAGDNGQGIFSRMQKKGIEKAWADLHILETRQFSTWLKKVGACQGCAIRVSVNDKRTQMSVEQGPESAIAFFDNNIVPLNGKAVLVAKMRMGEEVAVPAGDGYSYTIARGVAGYAIYENDLQYSLDKCEISREGAKNADGFTSKLLAEFDRIRIERESMRLAYASLGGTGLRQNKIMKSMLDVLGKVKAAIDSAMENQ